MRQQTGLQASVIRESGAILDDPSRWELAPERLRAERHEG